ncbi:MAG: hypothetical protein JRE45_02535 [Deltaproteobacteria bacterium]|nr:hypothetical protein [Deltaproteobacteria bacterium]MBW2686360.1 hypothetical protein [Deltaproteobacteria bacterium]
MHTLKQMDPKLYAEVIRKQAQVWDDLIAAFTDTWDRLFQPLWTAENRVSVDDVLADLAYGRD